MPRGIPIGVVTATLAWLIIGCAAASAQESEPNAGSQDVGAPQSDAPPDAAADASPSTNRFERLDVLDALWTSYQFHYVDDGRVIGADEDGVTTSEGQGYAM